MDGFIEKELICCIAQGHFLSSPEEDWWRGIGRKFPSIRCILDWNSAWITDYRMWWGEKRTGLGDKKHGSLSSTHLENWSKGYLGASGSPSAGWSNWLWLLCCFPLQVSYAWPGSVWRGTHLRPKYICWRKVGFQKWKIFLLLLTLPYPSFFLPFGKTWMYT